MSVLINTQAQVFPKLKAPDYKILRSLKNLDTT